MPTASATLLVCLTCWQKHLPERPAPEQLALRSLEDCFVCQQALGRIYVAAEIVWTPLDDPPRDESGASPAPRERAGA